MHIDCPGAPEIVVLPYASEQGFSAEYPARVRGQVLQKFVLLICQIELTTPQSHLVAITVDDKLAVRDCVWSLDRRMSRHRQFQSLHNLFRGARQKTYFDLNTRRADTFERHHWQNYDYRHTCIGSGVNEARWASKTRSPSPHQRTFRDRRKFIFAGFRRDSDQFERRIDRADTRHKALGFCICEPQKGYRTHLNTPKFTSTANEINVRTACAYALISGRAATTKQLSILVCGEFHNLVLARQSNPSASLAVSTSVCVARHLYQCRKKPENLVDLLLHWFVYLSFVA